MKTSANPSIEKHLLIQKYIAGEIQGSQIGAKLISIDDRNRSKKLASLVGLGVLLTLLLSPFLPAHQSSRD